MSYTMYRPLNVWLDPASIADVVAHIQEYLTEYPLINQSDIEQIVVDYIIAHPELMGGVDSVNGKTGEVVLTASDINTTNNTTIQAVINSLSADIADIVQSVTTLSGRVKTNETGITNESTARANADTALSDRITALQGAVGSPLVAVTATAMTDTSKIYVYTGSETGYTSGNWYYYDGSAWVSGGVYNATAINTDTTLTVAGMAADAKATGDGLNDLKSSVSEGLYKETDNLLDFGFIGGTWEQGGAGGVTPYQCKTKININSGTLYGTINKSKMQLIPSLESYWMGLFIQAYDSSDAKIGAEVALSNTNAQQTTSFEIPSGCSYVMVVLSTGSWNNQFTPNTLDSAPTAFAYLGLTNESYSSFNSNYVVYGVYNNGHIQKLNDEIDSIGIPFAAMLTSDYLYTYPMIDTYAKTLTLYPHFIVRDRRFSNGYYETQSTIVCDYSSVASSAVVFALHVENGTIDAFAFRDSINYKTYIPLIMLRANRSAVSSITPVIVDGRMFGNLRYIEQNQCVRGIAHRGNTRVAPENTLIAFKYAKQNNFDWVETDVRFTSDGVPVLLHDETINRTARNSDGTEIASSIRISDITYEQALQYDFGIWKGSQFAGQKIPTFEQFCIVCHRLGLMPEIELKAGTQAQIESLVDTAYKSGLRERCIWVAYSSTLIEYVKTADQSAEIGLNIDTYNSGVLTTLENLKTQTNTVFLVVTSSNLITNELVESLVQMDVGLYLYTNQETQMISDPYITGITTDALNPSFYLNNMWNTNV